MTNTSEKRIPITILTGFLGAGKTTLLNHILHSDHGLRIAVLVNDFREVNIDALLVVGVEGETVSLANGCICCTIRDDLEKAVLDLIKAPNPPEYIIIEASGVSDPGAVALTFVASPELRANTRIDTILAMIDTEQLLRLDGQSAMLAERQISIPDLLVLNKVDLVPAKTVGVVKEMFRDLLPAGRIMETTYGRIPLELILSVGHHSLDKLQPDATLDVHVHPELDVTTDAHHHHHDHEHDDHMLLFNTWCYRSKRPFDYQLLYDAIKTLPPNIYRAKGIVCLSDNINLKRVLQVAGTRVNLTNEGEWDDQASYNELVFIGEAGSLDVSALQQRFDKCLLKDAVASSTPSDEEASWERQV